MEVKLRLIEQFMHLMEFNTVVSLLEAFETILQQCIDKPRNNMAICNTNLLMVSLII